MDFERVLSLCVAFLLVVGFSDSAIAQDAKFEKGIYDVTEHNQDQVKNLFVEDQVTIKYARASQMDQAGRWVRLGPNGEVYEIVGEHLPGAGTETILINYQSLADDITDKDLWRPPCMIFYQVLPVDSDGPVRLSDAFEVEPTLGVRPLPGEWFTLPQAKLAARVYPNPFNPSTTISYNLPGDAFVSIVIYDVTGQEVRRLVGETKAAGRYKVRWDGKDQFGRDVSSGVYFARIEAGPFSTSQKMLLLK